MKIYRHKESFVSKVSILLLLVFCSPLLAQKKDNADYFNETMLEEVYNGLLDQTCQPEDTCYKDYFQPILDEVLNEIIYVVKKRHPWMAKFNHNVCNTFPTKALDKQMKDRNSFANLRHQSMWTDSSLMGRIYYRSLGCIAIEYAKSHPLISPKCYPYKECFREIESDDVPIIEANEGLDIRVTFSVEESRPYCQSIVELTRAEAETFFGCNDLSND